MQRMTYPSVNRHNQTGHPSCLFARQEHNCLISTSEFARCECTRSGSLTVAHVPGGSFDLHQVLIDSCLPYRVGHAEFSDHGRVDHARANTVHPDILCTVLRGHGSSHLNDRTLGRWVKEARVAPLDYEKM